MTDPVAIAIAAVAIGGLGLLVGSFLNVVIHRVPAGASVVRPGSACPACGTPIAPRDNVPVLSWLILRGRCRACAAPIPARYPLVEAGTAVLWLGLSAWALAAEQLPLLPLLLVLGSAGLALAVIDVDHHRLPDVIVLPLYPVTLLGLLLAGLLGGTWPVLPAVLGILVWLVPIGGLFVVTGGRGMGFGDVKMAPVLGATLGWVAVSAAVVGVLAGFTLGAIVGIGLILARRAHRRSHLAFGPFLLAGSLLGLVAGPAVAQAYLGWAFG